MPLKLLKSAETELNFCTSYAVAWDPLSQETVRFIHPCPQELEQTDLRDVHSMPQSDTVGHSSRKCTIEWPLIVSRCWVLGLSFFDLLALLEINDFFHCFWLMAVIPSCRELFMPHTIAQHSVVEILAMAKLSTDSPSPHSITRTWIEYIDGTRPGIAIVSFKLLNKILKYHKSVHVASAIVSAIAGISCQ